MVKVVLNSENLTQVVNINLKIIGMEGYVVAAY